MHSYPSGHGCSAEHSRTKVSPCPPPIFPSVIGVSGVQERRMSRKRVSTKYCKMPERDVYGVFGIFLFDDAMFFEDVFEADEVV